MTSQINPYNIDGNYPVAGQDNDSQGFRDNFTNLRNNFVFAKNELEDLQSKVLLKNPLSGGSVNDVNYNDLAGTRLSNAQMKGVYQTARQLLDVDGVGDAGETLSFKTSNFYYIKTSGKLEIAFTDFPRGTTSGWGVMTVLIEIGASDTYRRVVFSDTLIGIENIPGYQVDGDSGLASIDFAENEVRMLQVGSYDGQKFYVVDISRGSNSSTLMIAPLSTAPASQVGLIAFADGNSIGGWDPLSTDAGVPYPVFYNGTEWASFSIGIGLSNFSVETNAPGVAGLSYDNTTGVFTFTPPSLSGSPITLDALSVSTGSPSGAGALSYNDETGVFTFTPALPDLNDIDDVEITTPAEKDIIYYDNENSKWINSSLTTILDSLGSEAYPLVEYAVTVADDGSGTQDVFHLNGTALKNSDGEVFTFVLNTNTRYRFDVSDDTNGEFKFSTTPDTVVEDSGLSTITDYTNGVTVVGTPGTAGAYVEIVITDDTPSPLYFWTPDLTSPSRDGTLIGAALPIHINGRTKPSQEIGDGDAIDLGLGSVYFVTEAAEASTLAAGTEGQVIVLAMKADGGDMAVTVDNAGWKNSGTGTITFDTIGDACTLQFISGKWFCIGNNGAVFG